MNSGLGMGFIKAHAFSSQYVGKVTDSEIGGKAMLSIGGTNRLTQMNIADVMSKDTPQYARCQRLRERVISVKPEICVERARIITRVYKENEKEDIFVKRAKAIDAILREMSIYILDDELVVGHQSSKQRSAPLFPDFAVDWVVREIDTFATRDQDKFIVPPEVKEEYLRDIVPYWKGRTLHDRLMSHLTEDVKLCRFDAEIFSVGLHEDGGLGHVAFDYAIMLTQGCEGIKERIREKMAELTEWKREDIFKAKFYNCCLSMLDSIVAFAERYADLAEKMAYSEKDEKRGKELLQIARNCRNVPRKPARTFYEALQSFWFVQLFPQIYDNGVSISPGRFDQYMYPYYEKDISDGTLSKLGAQELLESVWVKFTEPIKVYCKMDAAFHAGFPMGQNLQVSGLRPDGSDGTNDLSYRCIEAHTHMLLMQPNFSARVHRKSPVEYLRRVCEAIRFGNGMPQIVNDELFVPAITNLGVPVTEARNYVPVGCVETAPLNAWGRCNGGYFNLTKIVELALSDGRCRTSGKQVGLHTGDPKNFKSFDDVKKAYDEQMKYAMSRLVKWDNIIDMVHEELMPTPFTSMMVGDCIEKGKDVTSGGARYNWTGPLGVGIANAGDSLYSVKKLVFEDGKFTMTDIVDMLDNDFKGRESDRLYLLNRVDKYGNDLPEVDEMVKLATDAYFDAMLGYETYRGGPFVPALLPVASYVAFGMSTGATPDGRVARSPLADGISPNYGADKKGPTAVMKSVTCIDQVRCGNGVIFNQKILPSAISTPEGLAKFVQLIRGFIETGGGHVQFNIVSASTLRDAQDSPDKYKGLVVRVAGYSAFFNELAKEVQDSIIARTEQVI
jgi:formate C-acetyltransferase